MTITAENKSAVQIAALRSAAAVRERCAMVHRFVADGHSSHFTVDEARLEDVADYVAQVTREAYPGLDIPYHSRWRHFSVGGRDRWRELAASVRAHPMERARMAIDLVTVSVLLDAGAGDAWRYREPATGLSFSRSEGLAVASLDMFRRRGPATWSIILRASPGARPSRLRTCWRRSSKALRRSGPRDWCLTALRSAMPAGIAPCERATQPRASCRSTSSRNG